MGTKYSSVSISGYNSNPPADNGTVDSSNQVQWQKHLDKIGGPIKTAVESINTSLVTALDQSARSTTSTTTAIATDHLKTIQIASTISPAITVALSDAATMAAGYVVTVANQSATYACTISRVTGGDTINGATSNILIQPKSSITFAVNAGANGYNIISQAEHSLLSTSDITTTLQQEVNNQVAGTGVQNREIKIPPGSWNISTTITAANSTSNFSIIGAGRGVTNIIWTGSAGIPMIKLINARNVTIRDLSLIGITGTRPSYGIQSDVISPVNGTPAPSSNTFKDLEIWYCETGIGFTNDSGSFDNNNSEHTIDNVFFETITNDGVRIAHSSSLNHTISNCTFSNCAQSAISNVPATAGAGGSFTASGNRSGGCGTVLRLGWSNHALGAVGWRSEDDTKIMTTPTSFSTNATHVALIDFDATNNSFASPAIQFDAGTLSVLDLVSTNFSVLDLSFPTAGSTVNIIGGTWSTGTMTYANNVNIMGLSESAGTPTYTKSGSGILKIYDRTGTTNGNVYKVVTADAFSAANGLGRPDCFAVAYAAPGNLQTITGGYDGQVITLVFDNANTTLINGSGLTNEMSLNASVDLTPPAGYVLKLTFRSVNSTWYG